MGKSGIVAPLFVKLQRLSQDVQDDALGSIRHRQLQWGICMYYDSMVLDGKTLCSPCGEPQPSGKLPDGWASDSGFQFQIDITAANKTGGMYIDVADFSESE